MRGFFELVQNFVRESHARRPLVWGESSEWVFSITQMDQNNHGPDQNNYGPFGDFSGPYFFKNTVITPSN